MSRLTEALHRLQAGRPDQLAVPFKWTMVNFAREAGVHVTTIFAKAENGTHKHQDLIDKFETQKRGACADRTDQASVADELKSAKREFKAAHAETRVKEAALAQQAEVICELRARIRDYEKRDAQVKQLIQENEKLRAECRQLLRSAKLPRLPRTR